jgi:RES domain-containing protein
MLVYRLFGSSRSPSDPTGAVRRGGRWNSPGTAVLYTASSLSLACLELLVHVRDPRNLPDYLWASLEVSPSDVLDWEESEARTKAVLESDVLSREQGDLFIASRKDGGLLRSERKRVKRVPSIVVREEWNYLVDPRTVHLTWSQPLPFRFDPRLLDPNLR